MPALSGFEAHKADLMRRMRDELDHELAKEAAILLMLERFLMGPETATLASHWACCWPR